MNVIEKMGLALFLLLLALPVGNDVTSIAFFFRVFSTMIAFGFLSFGHWIDFSEDADAEGEQKEQP